MCVRSCVYNRKTYLKGVQKQQMVEYNIEYPYNEIILEYSSGISIDIWDKKNKFL